MRITKAYLEDKFNVPVFAQWRFVPFGFHTRGYFAEKGVIVPKDAKPDGIKGGGLHCYRYSFLFDERKYLPEAMWMRTPEVKFERPKLRVNFEK